MRTKSNSFIVVDGRKYYVKKDEKGDKYELIVEKLAHIASVNCAHYYYKYVGNVGYYISDDIASDGKFITASDLGLGEDVYQLYEIWDFLEKHFPYDSASLMSDFVLVYLFNFFIINSDLHSGNWGIKTDQDGHHELYIFDNEYSFNTNACHYVTAEFFEYPDEFFHNYDVFPVTENMKNLRHFIKTSDQLSNEVLVSLYELLDPPTFMHVLTEVDQEYGIKREEFRALKWLYETNYKEIGNLLREYKLIDGLVLK